MSKHFPQYYLIWGKQNFCYNIRNFKEAGTAAYILKNYQNGKKTTMFLKVFISHLGFIFHFNFQFDRSHFSVWNIRFHIAFNTFFSFHKLQLCSLIGKFWYIYVIRIKTNKSPPAYDISLNFPTTPPPPHPSSVYSEPKSMCTFKQFFLQSTLNEAFCYTNLNET